jgi:hypothetical protein
MWNYYAIVFLMDGCAFLIHSFNLPTSLLCHICCVLCAGWHCDRMLCLFDFCYNGMLKLNGTGDCETWNQLFGLVGSYSWGG